MPIPAVSPATITAFRGSIPTIKGASLSPFTVFSPNREKEGRTTKMSPKNLQSPEKTAKSRNFASSVVCGSMIGSLWETECSLSSRVDGCREYADPSRRALKWDKYREAHRHKYREVQSHKY